MRKSDRKKNAGYLTGHRGMKLSNASFRSDTMQSYWNMKLAVSRTNTRSYGNHP